MKHRLPLLMLAIIAALFSQAQKLHFGLKTDFNFTNNIGQGLAKNFKSGFDVGGFSEMNFNKKWGLQPEVLFSQRNTNRADNFTTYYVTEGYRFANMDVQLCYVSIPVLVRYMVNDIVTVNFGPEYNVLVYDNENLLTTNKNAFTKIDAGLAGGIQLNLSSFSMFGRYYYGFANINNIDNRYKWHTQQLQAGIGYRIF